jgi:hypothetical protein
MHKFMVKHEVSDEFLADILITAVEGGINYWAQVESYTHSRGPEYTRAMLTPADEDPRDWPAKHIVLDTTVILKGLQRVLNLEVGCGEEVLNWIISGTNNNDAGEIDADAADVIVQAGIFGRLVYG